MSTMERESSVRSADQCVVCGAELAVEGCCSVACVLEAEREMRHNAALLQRREGRDVSRRERAERNGRLVSALLRWRGTPTGSSDRDLADDDATPVT